MHNQPDLVAALVAENNELSNEVQVMLHQMVDQDEKFKAQMDKAWALIDDLEREREELRKELIGQKMSSVSFENFKSNLTDQCLELKESISSLKKSMQKSVDELKRLS